MTVIHKALSFDGAFLCLFGKAYESLSVPFGRIGEKEKSVLRLTVLNVLKEDEIFNDFFICFAV